MNFKTFALAAMAGMIALPALAEPRRQQNRCEQRCETPVLGPKIGDTGRNARPFQRAERSRLPEPPARQEYRVMDDTLVRVDRDTQKITAVVGSLGALMR